MTIQPQNSSLTIIRPDDWHLHLRDNEALTTTVAHSARAFARAIVMPNLKPPVSSVAQADDYKRRIEAATPAASNFKALMTLYLTDTTSTTEIIAVQQSPSVIALKYYPAGATTNSENGVTQLSNVYPVLEKMAQLQIPLLVHGEVTDHQIDIFDREQVFIDTVLAPLRARIPELKIVLEHITTAQAVQWVQAQSSNVAATITVHHLLYNRNHMLVGGIRPHFYCLPILKRDIHQQALIAAATGGDKRFFLGTDSAPHSTETKETDCGCAGIYSSPAAIELYAEVFDQANALDKLEGFASLHGPGFYQLPINADHITVVKKPWSMPSTYPLANGSVVPIRAGEALAWQIAP